MGVGSAVNLLGKFGKFLDGRSHLIVSRHDTIVTYFFPPLLLPWAFFLCSHWLKSLSPQQCCFHF